MGNVLLSHFWALIIYSLFASTTSLLSKNFRHFLRHNYGRSYEKMLTRADLGDGGSFGGGDTPNIINRPIIFVHGITNIARNMKLTKAYFEKKGYSDNELYATSYAPFGHRTWFDERGNIECKYVETVRFMIKAVLAYTNSTKVDVISYSMGVVVSRKAILGGKCVDTDTDLGEPLTDSIKNFIGIAGPNHGAFICANPLSLLLAKPCNSLNGMSCNSKFLKDINSREHYEGEFVYVIQTFPDSVVGNIVCDSKFTTRIEGANDTVTTYGQMHIGVHFLSAPQQYELIKRNE